jgi:hypothetical protein
VPPLDPIGIAISVGGVSFICFMVWLLTKNDPKKVLGGEAGVRNLLAHELLGFQVAAVVVDVTDRRALAKSADGTEVALVFVMGGKVDVWRTPIAKLGKAVLKPTSDGKTELELHLGDFTRPDLSFVVRNAEQLKGLLPQLAG